MIKGTLKALNEVLISTYWNVNEIDFTDDMQRGEGFNLNLLECKLFTRPAIDSTVFCFNLNLLECKFHRRHRQADYWQRVLISTYWNVNPE